MKNFGKRLTKLRKDRDLSLEQLAEELNITDIALKYWERSCHILTIINIIKVAKYFKVSVDFLLGL